MAVRQVRDLRRSGCLARLLGAKDARGERGALGLGQGFYRLVFRAQEAAKLLAEHDLWFVGLAHRHFGEGRPALDSQRDQRRGPYLVQAHCLVVPVVSVRAERGFPINGGRG